MLSKFLIGLIVLMERVNGKGIGKSIGWPTANLEIDGRKFLPGEGVYAAWTTIDNSNQKIESIMNLGIYYESWLSTHNKSFIAICS